MGLKSWIGSRNCHLTDDRLQLFDVILRTADEEMEWYPGIYPEG